MPLSADANLDRLYSRQRMLEEEAERLDSECDTLAEALGSTAASAAAPAAGPAAAPDAAETADRIYVLEVAARALREESTKLSAQISNILDRDLQR